MPIAYIVSMLHNTKTNRFHPIYFRHAPMPGPEGFTTPRYKSGGHHTEGFDTKEEADKSAIELGVRITEKLGPCLVNVERCFPWDGEDIPAIVSLFTEEGVPI